MKILSLSMFSFLTVIVVRFIYTDYYTSIIHPDFTVPLNKENLTLIKEYQNTYKYLLFYVLIILLFYVINYLYIYRQYRKINFLYTLPLSLLIFDVYIFFQFNEPFFDITKFLVVEVVPPILLLFIFSKIKKN